MNHNELLFYILKDVREFDTDQCYGILDIIKEKLSPELLEEFWKYADKKGGV